MITNFRILAVKAKIGRSSKFTQLPKFFLEMMCLACKVYLRTRDLIKPEKKYKVEFYILVNKFKTNLLLDFHKWLL